jgi:hypothetical protein
MWKKTEGKKNLSSAPHSDAAFTVVLNSQVSLIRFRMHTHTLPHALFRPLYACACLRIRYRMRYFADAVVLNSQVSSYYMTLYMCPHTMLLYTCVLILRYCICVLRLYYTTGYILLYYCTTGYATRWIYSQASPCHMPFAILTISQHWICSLYYLHCCTNVYYTTGYTTRWIRWYTCHCQTATFRTNYQSTLTLVVLTISQCPAILYFLFSVSVNITEKKRGKKKILAEQLGRCPSKRGMTYGMPLIRFRMHTHTLPHALFCKKRRCPSQRGMTYGMRRLYASACIR